MNRDGASGVGGRTDWADAHAREIETRATEEHAERFAQALAPHVAAHVPAVSVPPQNPPGGWRASDGVLTRRAPSAETAAAGAEMINDSHGTEGGAKAERIVVSVQAGDLGELSLVLDRSEAGLRVVIGVQDARSAEAMLPEKNALLRRLEQTGLSIASVQIVRQSEVGTVLAPARTVGSQKTPNASERAEQERQEEARRRGSRKLNLIG